MANLNRVFMIGNLTRDPELRYIPSGQAVATFSIAMNRVYTANGERKEDVSFVRVVTWAKLAEVCAQYLKKGSPVFVEGRLQSRSWETQDGQKRSILEVVANNVQFLSRGQGKGAAEGGSVQAADSGSVQAAGDQVRSESSPQTQEDEVPF